MVPLARPLAIALLVGTALLGVGAAFHPMLPGDVPGQLRLIAATWYFRPVHLAMLSGSALIILGVWTRLLLARGDTPGAMIAALAAISLGFCFNAIDIAFMGGAGWQLAGLFQAGQAEVAPLFDALHRVGLLTARFGNCLVALGALLLGWVERRDATSAWWASWLAWIAGAGGLACVLLVPESSLLMLTAVTLISGWSVATSVRALRA